MSVIRTAALLFFLFTSAVLMAQPHFVDGYYISTKGDTVFGKIDDFNPYILRMKGKGKIPAHEIKSYYFIDDNRKFVHGEVKNLSEGFTKTRNLEVLYEGDISLYSRRSKLYLHPSGESIYYMSHREKMIFEDGKHYMNNVKGYAGTMIHFMQPCIAEEDFKDSNFNRRSVTALMDKYYDCQDAEPRIYADIQPSIRFSLAPFIGLTSANRSMEVNERNLNNIDFTSERTTSYGVMALLQFPRWTDVLAVEFGYQTVTLAYRGQVKTEDIWLQYETDLYEEVSETSINIGARYQMPYKLSPYVFLGTELVFMKSDGMAYEGRRINDDIVTEIPPGTIEIIYETSVGLNTGAGVVLNLGIVNPYLEYRIKRHANFASDDQVSSKNASLQQQNIIFGIRVDF